MQPHNFTPKNAAGTNPALTKALERLRKTIVLNVAGQEREWTEAVGTAVDGLEIALRQRKAEAPDGIIAKEEMDGATQARQVAETRRDHDELLKEILDLRREVFRAAAAFHSHAAPAAVPPGVVDFGDIRRRAEKILQQMQQTSKAETKLVQESLNTDVGVGD